MNPDRTAPATIGDLHDLKSELKSELKSDMDQLRTDMTNELFAEMSRIANVVMEHMSAQIRGLNDHWKAVEDRLDSHITDASVHRRATRSRR